MTRLTLITTTYNSGATVADTLRSVAAQSYPHIEHVIADGGSSDNTLEILRQHGERLADVRSERDRGFYDACNKAIARAGGDVVGIINSDDFYAHKDVLSHAMRAFDDPAVDAVHADLVYVAQDDPDRPVRFWRSRPCTDVSLRQGYIPAHPTVFVRRSVYERAGGFDLSYRLAADYEFLLRIFRQHRIKARYIPEIWVRMRTGGATGGSIAEIKRQNDEIIAAREKHGISYPRTLFFARKVADRLAQRVRARSVVLPSPGFAR